MKTRDQIQESDIAKDDNKCQEQNQFQNSSTLSVDPEQSRLVGIPLLLLKDIFPRHQSYWPQEHPYWQWRHSKTTHSSLELTMERDHSLYVSKMMEK